MSANAALVLSDSDTLQKICGVNDRNITHLERLFDAAVQVRGNELTLDSSQPAARDHFNHLLVELERCVQRGHDAEPGLIETLFRETGTSSEISADGLHAAAIEVPFSKTRVFPRSAGQAAAVRSLREHSLSFLIGPAGTGKTYLAVAFALQELLSKRKRKLIVSRPVVEAGESLGFLPGDLAQKIHPYLRPLYDAIDSLLGPELVRRLFDQNLIEVAPLAYMRGRSLRDCYVILDEAQNTTREQMKMFLTRLGENSTAVVTGDVTQVDLPRRQPSGLVHAASILTGLEDIQVVYLSRRDVVRSALVQRIIQAYDEQT